MVLIRRPRDGALLVSEGTDPAGLQFHRPLGGHVEFGEYALDTVHREFAEEIGQALKDVRLAGVLENIFQWDGATQHEIVFIFAAAFAEATATAVPPPVNVFTVIKPSFRACILAVTAANIAVTVTSRFTPAVPALNASSRSRPPTPSTNPIILGCPASSITISVDRAGSCSEVGR